MAQESQQEAEHRHVIRRYNIFFFFAFLLFVALILRLSYIQLVNGQWYRQEVNQNQTKSVYITAPRGWIKDRNGNVLVSNKPVFTVTMTVMPQMTVDDYKQLAAKLSPLIDSPADEIFDKMDVGPSRKMSSYIPRRIKVGITDEQVAKISERLPELPGIEVNVEPIRDYKYGKLAAHILGYTRPVPASQVDQYLARGYRADDRVGYFGVEKEYETQLKGKDGRIEIAVNNLYQRVGQKAVIDPIPGNDLILTIDLRLQQKVEQILNDTIKELHTRPVNPMPQVKTATAVVMSPKTGEVLAMANYPSFDPNVYNSQVLTQEVYEREIAGKELNLAIAGAYPPGSTVKPLTVMLGLQEGAITPQTRVYDPGYLVVGDRKKYNWKRSGEGWVTPKEALMRSNNTFMYQVALNLAHYPASTTLYREKFDVFRRYDAMFGLGVLTGIDLPEESSGWKATDIQLGRLADAAIGQYDNFTAIQLAQYVSTIANGGYRLRPHVLKAIESGGNTGGKPGRILSSVEPEVLNRVDVDPAYIQLVKEGMHMVAENPRGTAYPTFRGLPVDVAAKTGTAQTGTGNDNALIVGFAPYEDPEMVFVVIVPKGGGGSETSGPIARKIIQAYFGLDQEGNEASAAND